MFPIRDENPTSVTPLVVYGLIAINLAVWFFEYFVVGVDRASFSAGAIPYELVTGKDLEGTVPVDVGSRVGLLEHHPAVLPWPLSAFSAMFMHGGWMHVAGNLWFLWIFGDNVEDALGHIRFVVFYVLCGLLATAAHVAADPYSPIPMVGASGAIAGVLGAYLVLYPRHRIVSLVFLFVFVSMVHFPAWIWLGVWFVLQFFTESGQVAWLAHVGGFLAGMALLHVFLIGRPVRPRRVRVVRDYDF